MKITDLDGRGLDGPADLDGGELGLRWRSVRFQTVSFKKITQEKVPRSGSFYRHH